MWRRQARCEAAWSRCAVSPVAQTRRPKRGVKLAPGGWMSIVRFEGDAHVASLQLPSCKPQA